MMNKAFKKNECSEYYTQIKIVILFLTTNLLISFNCSNNSSNPSVQQLNNFVTYAKELEKESLRGVEYFNAPAYDSIVAMGNINAERLKKRIKEPNRKYFLTLLALRTVSHDTVYSQLDNALKLGILTDALNEAIYFNAWGLPNLYSDSTWTPTEPVKAFEELGQPGVHALTKLLAKKRTAPRWGSEEVAQNNQYKYRVADYALGLILKIEEKPFPGSIVARDRLCVKYLGQLAINH